ncbi:MAG: hypothetical protein ACOC44_05290 [Promethearchaeia archaeon]
MSEYIKEYEFESAPKEITYSDGEPLKLTNKFRFYHNKSFFRKALNPLQYLFKSYLKQALMAVGIRDTYLKREYGDNYLMVIFTEPDKIHNANKIVGEYASEEFDDKCYYMKSTSDYLLLIAKNKDLLLEGIDTLKTILSQTLEDYLRQKEFDEFIKIRNFTLCGCVEEE